MKYYKPVPGGKIERVREQQRKLKRRIQMATATGGQKGSWLGHIKGTSPMTIKAGGKSPKATSMPSVGSKAK